MTRNSPPAAPESAGELAGHSASPEREWPAPFISATKSSVKASLFYYQSVTASDSLALVLELLTWVALVPGVLLLVVGYARLAFGGRFQETWGVIIPSPAGTPHKWFRWMDLSRELQSAPVPGDAERPLEIGDEVRVYFDPRHPEKGRLDHPSSDGRLLRVVGWVLVAVGVGAAIAQLVTLILE
ncbi:MAG: putative sortase-sorted rane protein [Microbacteriaceae bacterium]|jgi:hypothetical protein|nr:putative sortase-sorted rane protein [Microbacteriaceae bacterium]HEV7956887.1 hypothetical protein [Marisediminicola sp.]